MNDFELIFKNLAEREEDIRRREEEIAKDKEEIKRERAALEILAPVRRSLGLKIEPSRPAASAASSLREAMEMFLGGITGTFSAKHVIDYLSSAYPEFNLERSRGNISVYLKKFAEEGLLRIVEEGSGRRGTVYEKK